ncbi:ComEC/Rec2 family competence protein, partial [[Mycoplasma] falconis]|uniref:ComEC/Rec2 family competence protein n=1 Tax=[Mycoplasma] falconis TaxID=92403 RepID=UPI001B87D442
IFAKLKINKFIANFIILNLLLSYLILINFLISATRAFVFILLISVNDSFKKKLKNIDSLLITAFIFVLINPYIFYNFSFILSFAITFVILLSIEITKTWKNGFLKFIFTLFLAYFISTLIVNNFENKINILGFIYQLIFMPIICLIYALSIIFCWSNWITYYLFYSFNLFINFISVSIININFKLPYFLPIVCVYLIYEIYFFKLIKKEKIKM